MVQIKNWRFNWLIIVLLVTAVTSRAQSDTLNKPQSDTLAKRYQVAVFTPLYLDSAFDASLNYRYGKNFPKFLNPGLEFYEGIQLAIDSLQKENVELDVHVYDTRSASTKVDKIVSAKDFDDINLIIGHVNGPETRQLGNEAAKRNIPFINVNYPNDAGVNNNPYFVILNSTLATHCSALYKFLQRNFALSTITVFIKKGPQEDRLKAYFTDIEKATSSVPLKLKFVTLDDNFTPAQIQKHLDPDITNVCIGGSLDMNFAENLAEQLTQLQEKFAVTLFGMPTWDAIDYTQPEFKNLEVYFGTPFYIQPTDKLATQTEEQFKLKFYSRPSDMVYRGFETLYHFAHLLMLHGNNISSSLSDKKFHIFNEYDIQPVINPKTTTLDYFENKKIYFIKMHEGELKAAY